MQYYVSYGMIEWGIMPVAYQGNLSGWDRIETEMVSMILPKTTKVLGVDYDDFIEVGVDLFVQPV